MGGITMWAILGSLIGLIIVFLVVTSLLDRRKKKRIKLATDELNTAIAAAKDNAVIFLSELMNKNNKTLQEFVPSIGKLKMSDIRDAAKASIKFFRNSEEYRLIAKDEGDNHLIDLFNSLERTTCNTWDKEFEKPLKKLISKIDLEKHQDQAKTYLQKIEAIYNEHSK